jgi:hypothetical protein
MIAAAARGSLATRSSGRRCRRSRARAVANRMRATDPRRSQRGGARADRRSRVLFQLFAGLRHITHQTPDLK